MRRHDRVFLRHGAPFRAACAEIDPAAQACVRQWIDAGRPLVAARQTGEPEAVRLGLTLPTAQGRKRLGIVVERRDVAAVRAPLGISQCLCRLPASDAVALSVLESSLERAGVAAGVYGSLAWEVMADAAYRHAESDIDLVCDVHSLSQLCLSIAALRQCASRLAGRLDGEIRLPNGDAVAWRELADRLDSPQASVLVKGAREVGLLSVQDLLGSLGGERRCA